MTRKSFHIILTFCAAAVAILWYMLTHDLLIIAIPQRLSLQEYIAQRAVQKKHVVLWYWTQNRWHHEDVDIIWDEHKGRTLHRLLVAWFTVLQEEGVLKQPVGVQSVALAATEHDALISLDCNPFEAEEPVFQKWLLVEGLLKTIRSNGIKINAVTLLVHHQPLEDVHLDFSNPWPITGFYEE